MGKTLRYKEVRFFLEEDLLSPSFIERAIGLSVMEGTEEVGKITRIRRIRHLGRDCVEVSIDVEDSGRFFRSALSISMGVKRDSS